MREALAGEAKCAYNMDERIAGDVPRSGGQNAAKGGDDR